MEESNEERGEEERVMETTYRRWRVRKNSLEAGP